MEPRCRVALLKSRQALIRDLDVEPALDRLLSEFAITQADRSKIRAEKLDHNKRRALLDLLLERGQKAFDVFLDHLGHGEYSQPWLQDSVRESLATVTQEELEMVQEEFQQLSKGGPTAQDLQQVLRRNINKFIKNDPSRILKEAGSAAYVIQPVTVREREHGRESLVPGHILDFLETCSPEGQRVFVYGAAGMGKTSLCYHIAKLWVGRQSKLCQQFDYVFPIPMRSVRSHSLLDIICKDVELIPATCKQRIEQELEMKSVLFFLDSLEEMSHETAEIDKLIQRELYPNSSVVVSARPGHRLEDKEAKTMPCIKAELQSLREDQVVDYITSYPGLHKYAHLSMHANFGMSFLCRPINLWLLCLLVAETSTSTGIPETQTVLLNMIIQRLVLAYCKKKKLPEFAFTEESPMKNAPTEAKLLLEKVGQLCYYGLREKSLILSLDDGVLSKVDLMAIGLGLFSEGADDNSVTLPHPLFQEYLAALFLSIDKRARQDLFRELKEQSERSSIRPWLIELLRPRGMDNMVRFLVGLCPGAVKELSGLFSVKREHHYSLEDVMRIDPSMVTTIWEGRAITPNSNIPATSVCDISYEFNLLRECNNHAGKAAVAAALLEAPVSDGYKLYAGQLSLVGPGRKRDDSQDLFLFFNEEQRETFLRKFYGCQICNHELVLAPESREFRLDSFVVGMVYIHKCTVNLKKAAFHNSRIPVSLLTDKLAAVEVLTLGDCRLCDLTESQFLASLNLASQFFDSTATPFPSLKSHELSLNSVELSYVVGLDLLSTSRCTLPTTRTLSVYSCGDVNLGSLSQCFTGVTKLTLQGNKRVYTNIETDAVGQWPSVREIDLNRCESAEVVCLKEMFVQLEVLKASFGTKLFVEKADPATCRPTEHQWCTVKSVQLDSAHLHARDASTGDSVLTEEDARVFLTHLCPQAKLFMKGF